jgi:hypothetical protein
MALIGYQHSGLGSGSQRRAAFRGAFRLTSILENANLAMLPSPLWPSPSFSGRIALRRWLGPLLDGIPEHPLLIPAVRARSLASESN